MNIVIRGGYTEEIRNGYQVTERRKHIWATELELYGVFAELCEKYHLQYCVAFGSLLGAIRHSGFIPWDDDFDVMMPRKDYDELCEIAPKELGHPYFFQTPYTDEDYFYSFAKLRDSRTTSFYPVYRSLKFNKGICLDIFPLDYCDPETAAGRQEKIYKHIMACSSYMKRYGTDLLNKQQLENYYKYQTDNPIREFEAIQEIARNSEAKDSGWLGVSAITKYPYAKMIWPAKCFEEYKSVEFENIHVRVPKGHDVVLETTYGNYMEFPPIEKRGTWHSGVILDPFSPYIDYQNGLI